MPLPNDRETKSCLKERKRRGKPEAAPLPRRSRCSSSGSQPAKKRCSRVGCKCRCPGCPPPSYTDVRLKKNAASVTGPHEVPAIQASCSIPSRIRYGPLTLTGNAVPHGWRHDCQWRETTSTSHWPKFRSGARVTNAAIGVIYHVFVGSLSSGKLYFPGCPRTSLGAGLRHACACACGPGWAGGGSEAAGWGCEWRAMFGWTEPGPAGLQSWRGWQ